ncbi:hypothetical protein J132_05431 [Termitomyces sp. J132]|nr:hypothetical protein J132_05431 [Termitomyces sp. J132]
MWALWKQHWKKSPWAKAITQFNKTAPSKDYMRIIKPLKCKQSAILMQLRTGHIPLNHHLFRIQRPKTPLCPHCGDLSVVNVKHFLLKCPKYAHKRFIHLTRPLKRKAESTSYLLSAPETLKHLFRYTDATKCLHTLQEP